VEVLLVVLKDKIYSFKAFFVVHTYNIDVLLLVGNNYGDVDEFNCQFFTFFMVTSMIEMDDSPMNIKKEVTEIKKEVSETEQELPNHQTLKPEQNDQNDPIITEIDVHFATEMGRNLKLLQFPTRPMNDSSPTEGRIKRNKLQMKIPLDITGPHYSSEMGEHFSKGVGTEALATALDGPSLDENSDRLEYMTMESNHVPMNARYMVGILAADGFLF
jgi:hypothetical protein